jgi:hypothetical protein
MTCYQDHVGIATFRNSKMYHQSMLIGKLTTGRMRLIFPLLSSLLPKSQKSASSLQRLVTGIAAQTYNT